MHASKLSAHDLFAVALPLGVLDGGGVGAGEGSVLLHFRGVEQILLAANHRAESMQIAALHKDSNCPG